jgi:hypothetical protein
MRYIPPKDAAEYEQLKDLIRDYREAGILNSETYGTLIPRLLNMMQNPQCPTELAQAAWQLRHQLYAFQSVHNKFGNVQFYLPVDTEFGPKVE